MRIKSIKSVHSNRGANKTNLSAPRVRGKTKKRESDLLKEIKSMLEILKKQGLISYRRIHVMPVMRGGRMAANPDQAGMEDLQVYLLYGRTLYWELKSATGTQSELQKKRQAELSALGHCYRVIRSLDQAISELAANGLNIINMGETQW